MTIQKEIAEKIIAYCRSGFTAADAAAQFQVSLPTVNKLCDQAGVIFRNKRANDRVEIARWVKANKATARQAMNHFKISLPTLHRACSENGVELKREKAKPAIGGFKILAALMDSEKPVAEIAAALGISRQRVEEVKVAATEARILGPRSRFTVKRKNANKS